MQRRLGWSVGCLLVAASVVAGCGSSGTQVGAGGPGTSGTTATTELMLTCGWKPFPASAFDGPVGAERGADPPDQALAAWLATQGASMGAPPTGWTRLYLDDDFVEYASAVDASGQRDSLNFERHGDVWKWSGSGGCGAATVVVPGTGETRWSLDPAFPAPGPADTTVHVIADRMACSSGEPLTPEEVHAPVITFTADSVAVLYVSDSVSPGSHTCQGSMGTLLTLDLGQPLGRRKLLDGAVYPPAPVESSSSP